MGRIVRYMFLLVLDIVKKTGAALGFGVRLVSPREKLIAGECPELRLRGSMELDNGDSVLRQCLVSCSC